MNHYYFASWHHCFLPRRLAKVALSIVALSCVSALFGVVAQAQQPSASDDRAASQGVVGDTELHWAAYRGHADVVAQLLRSGARVDQRVDRGSSPLHLAAYKGHHDVVSVLIASGANVNARNEEGTTPLDWARSNEHAKTEQLLLANGAVVGKPLPVKSRSKRGGRVGSSAPNPGQFLFSKSGEYHNASRTKRKLAPIIEEEVIERPIQPEQLNKLESVAQINQTMERYRNAQAWEVADGDDVPEIDSSDSADAAVDAKNDTETGNAAQPAPVISKKVSEEVVPTITVASPAPPSAQAYRVQLAAVGESDRAQVLRTQYAQSYDDVFGAVRLVVEPVNAAGRTLYRLRSSALSENEAETLCEQLKRRGQDCITVVPTGN